MKTVSRVFVTTLMVLTAISAITAITIVIVSMLNEWLLMTFAIAACVIAATLVEMTGRFALSKIETAKTRNELIPAGIVTILFCSFLGGIFMLCIDDSDLSA